MEGSWRKSGDQSRQLGLGGRTDHLPLAGGDDNDDGGGNHLLLEVAWFTCLITVLRSFT